MIERRRYMGGEIAEYITVDLALPSGKLWAQKNVGAQTELDVGLFFSVGNIDGHVYGDGYAFDTANYNISSGYSISSGIVPTDAQYDAAFANCGPDWRIPTKEEFDELIQNTIKSVVTIDGIKASQLKGTNGNYILIPFSGRIENSTLAYTTYAYSLTAQITTSVQAIQALLGSVNTTYTGNRAHGLPVRPIYNH